MKRNVGQIYIWVLVLLVLLVGIGAAVYWFKIPIPWLITLPPVATIQDPGNTETVLQAQSQALLETERRPDLSIVAESEVAQLQEEIKTKQQELSDARQEHQQALEDMKVLKQLINDTEESIKTYEAEVKILKSKQ